MKIFVDIGHPAHVHYFRNFIKIMQSKGHTFFISARDKEVSQILLNFYGIPFYNRGKGSKNLLGKLLYLIRTDVLLLIKAIKFKPDLFLSFASPYTAHVSKILRKQHVAFTDTENAKLGIISFAPFSSVILTPSYFRADFGPKHIRFKSFMELGYLHSKYFSPNKSIFKDLNIQENEKFALIRFVSWGANHDIGETGIKEREKDELIEYISNYMRVFISSENELPKHLQPFKLNITPQKIHDVLFFADLCISEGATIASECAMIGTPAIYINTLQAGTILKQMEYDLIWSYKDYETAKIKIHEVVENRNIKKRTILNKDKMIKENIDVTEYMVNFIENISLT